MLTLPAKTKALNLKKAQASLSLRKGLTRFFLMAVVVFLGFLAIAFWAVEPPDPRDFPVSPVFLDRDGELLYGALTSDDEWLIPVRLAKMGQWLPKVAVGIEDKRFYNHFGVDPLAVLRALGQNLSNFKVISGASTITVQLVRLSRPRPRTLWSKFIEYLEAIKLERKLSKNEILEIYLNRAPFGGNIRGVGAAAAIYFGKKPHQLSLGESATLVALLRGPSIYRPDRHPELATLRRDFILKLLLAKNIVSPQEVISAQTEIITKRRHKLPQKAPHLARRLLAQNADSYRWDKSWAVHSTLSWSLEDQLEKRLSLVLRDFPQEVNGAGIILDNSNGQILAYVGGVRPNGPSSYVDHAISSRSSGSTFKPFIYLEAFAGGDLGPASMLADTPLSMSGQAPRNFDLSYRGPVAAGQALAESLNAPAARVLRIIGQKRSLLALSAAGFGLSLDKEYGDSLVLGGAETTLLELVGAYGTLATGGNDVKPVFSLSATSELDSNSNQKRLWDSAPVWLINESLRDNSRLPVGLRGDNIAFKTGTSHGLRDAWFVAYTPSYTLALWAGDSSGRSHEGLTGLKLLAPTAVSLMRALGPAPDWPGPPEGLERYKACPISGEPVSPNCPSFKWAWRLSAKATTSPCTLHVRRGGQIVTLWPPELFDYMTRTPQAKTALPKPVIVSPPDGAIIRLGYGAERLPLKSEGTVGDVYWYVDDAFLTKSSVGTTPVIALTIGSHRVSLLDARGLTSKSEFKVLAPKSESAGVLTVKR